MPIKVDWKRFSDELAAWERSTSHERFTHLCQAIERIIRKAFKRDEMLDYAEVTNALDCIAQDIVHMRRDSEGKRPCERIVMECEPGLAEKLKSIAAREGLETGELVALLIDRQLFASDDLRGRGPRGRRRDREE